MLQAERKPRIFPKLLNFYFLGFTAYYLYAELNAQLTKRRRTLEYSYRCTLWKLSCSLKTGVDNFLFCPGNWADDDRFKLNIIPDKPIGNKTLNSRFKAINKSGQKVPVPFYKARTSLRKDI